MKFLCEISVAFGWMGQVSVFIQEIAVQGVTECGLTVHQDQGEAVYNTIPDQENEKGKKGMLQAKFCFSQVAKLKSCYYFFLSINPS